MPICILLYSIFGAILFGVAKHSSFAGFFDSCADPRFNGDSLGLKGFQKVECGEIQFNEYNSIWTSVKQSEIDTSAFWIALPKPGKCLKVRSKSNGYGADSVNSSWDSIKALAVLMFQVWVWHGWPYWPCWSKGESPEGILKSGELCEWIETWCILFKSWPLQ